MEIRLVGDKMFHEDRRTGGRTDMTNVIVAFSNFAKAPEEDSA
jgi:hypothetical protein